MHEWKRVGLETGVVFGALILLAWIANGCSDDGIDVSRDYFKAQRQQPEVVDGEQAKAGVVEPDSPTAQAIRARLEAVGLRAANHDEVVGYFKNPAYEAGAFLFVDARNEKDYREGHIRGALLLDHFYPDRTIASVLEAAKSAAIVVVYCNGGDCTDSESVALDLTEQGLPAEQIVVYLGGMKAWKAAGLPVEEGDSKQ